MPAPSLHVLGCQLQTALYAQGQGPLDFSAFGLSVWDEIWGTDKDGSFVRYAAILQRADGKLLIVVRGTKTLPEWLSDADAVLIASLLGRGKVHRGFYGIYSTFVLKSGRPLISYLVAVVEDIVAVFGHSLGGPLATLLAAAIGLKGDLVCYASPKPGDNAFAIWVRSVIQGCIVLYQNAGDVVWRLPFTIEDPLDEFNFVPVLMEPVLIDGTKLAPPVLIPAGATWEEKLENNHSCQLAYGPLIGALP